MSLQETPGLQTTHSGQRTTPFGARENPGLQERTMAFPNILRVDLLVALRDIWGEDIVADRDTLYRLVSGDCTDEELQELLCKYYEESAAFANYCDEQWCFGDNSETFLYRIIKPARDLIEKYRNIITGTLRANKCICHGEDQDYMYLQCLSQYVPSYEGGEKLC